MPTHLETRRAGYYWRRRLPRSLQDHPKQSSNLSEAINTTPSKIFFKKSFLCFSLRTHVLRDAKILARRLTEMSDLVFAADAEVRMAITPDIQIRMLESLARFEIEAFERTRSMAAPRSPEAAVQDLRREEALQMTLRQAIYLNDREVAQRPLQHVAAHLGIELNMGDEDWCALAYEATKVLLDVSLERSRRQQGIYEQPTHVFRRAVSTVETTSVQGQTVPAETTVAPAVFASAEIIPEPAAPAPAPAPASFATETDVITTETAHEVPTFAGHSPIAQPPVGETPAGQAPILQTPMAQTHVEQTPMVQTPEEVIPQHAPACADEPSANPSPLMHSTSLTQAIIPAGFDIPAGYDEEKWQNARVAARPPRILIDQRLLCEQSRAALKKQRGITLVEAIELYFELLSWGYKSPFNKHQKRKDFSDRLKAGSVEDRLCEDHKSKRRMALNFWPAALGDEPVDEIHVDDVNDALERFRRIPANHGKSERDRNKYNLIELIDKEDAIQAQLEKDIEVAKQTGANSQDIDKIRLQGQVSRISVTTFVKHGRVMRGVGEMLMDMQLIDQNPFSICTWSNKDQKDLKSTEGERKREAWDDRINDLWNSRIFQNRLDDIGDPLFWAPLIARHQGMRMEEILQLGPEDFGSDKGVPYLRIRHTIINGVKTLSSARILPIHPQLIELGLLKLVALRKKEKHIRLFPELNRGKQKDSFSANFSKKFAYYRRTNDCYWPGLDFHSLRTTFHHDLLGDDKSDAIRCRLMGHTYTDEGDRSYGQSLGIETLANRMKSVVVDISMIRRPFEDHRMAPRHAEPQRHLRVVG
ncbi:DUF6538 domain-containing protein [Celeribacter halophilus]|uniref:DUF6538 domain-containing protein n=1 Tax=Celeribacter halophilus TaxID=576117 RepID=UPI003A954518